MQPHNVCKLGVYYVLRTKICGHKLYGEDTGWCCVQRAVIKCNVSSLRVPWGRRRGCPILPGGSEGGSHRWRHGG
jgi:hypothetical protein